MNPPPERLAAALAGRYRIERELGAGGMATVYLAEDLKHDRKVAIKVLRPELAAVIGADRFLTEIKTTANLQHPHILPLHDSGAADGFLFYVMPFVEGETVRDRLKREKQLPIPDALRIATEVASALDYAHRHGVIHRDIKPENILLHDGSALVADFGIALAASNAGDTRMTETGMSLGTPHYMSPEQAMGEREITARADVYALGCVLYEMLLGEPPFSGPTAQSIVSKVLSEKPAPLVARRDRVPAHVEEAVLTALEKLPADRFATAAAFAEALQGTGRVTTSGPRVAKARTSLASRLAWAVPLALVAIVIGYFAGRSSGASAGSASTEWRGELLGGPRVAIGPRVSPDGQLVAFQAMVDGQTQVGVLKPQSGDWTLLTTDRTKGLVGDVGWASDNSRIYFSRTSELPVGVYSISPLGTGERLVLEGAGSPVALTDGSLLVSRLNADRDLQMYHFWPATGRLDTLPATHVLGNGSPAFFSAFPDGREAAFIGRPAGVRDSTQNLYAIDLTSKRIRRLAPDISFPFNVLALTPDGRSVVVDYPMGNAHRLVAIPRDGSSGMKVLALLTSAISRLDIGRDGALYFDQGSRPTELRRYDPATKHAEAWAIPEFLLGSNGNILPLPDGRVLITVPTNGGTRVFAVPLGGQPQTLMAADQQTNSPLALLGQDRIALVLGIGADASIAIVSSATGQLIARLPGTRPTQMAGSPDGKTVYYVESSVVWSIPSAGGERHKIRDGDAVAVDPHGRFLVVELIDKTTVRLFRVPLGGGAEEEILLHSDMRAAPLGSMAPNAVHPDGRIALTVVSPASWFWPVAILDPRTGKLEVVPPGLVEDMYGGWDAQGRLMYTTQGEESSLWRFKPLNGKDRTP